jgi:malate dehydrogenase (oxaloacetate-decarboxylating)(NADP+)
VKFGPEYLIPFPFDPRVLLWVAPAVAWAAVASGAASEFVDLDEYRERLEARLGKARGFMRGVINRAINNPRKVVFPEGEETKIIRAAAILVDEGIAMPTLLGRPEVIIECARQANISLDDITIEDPATSPRREEYAHFLWAIRQRKGMSLEEARRRLFNGNYYGSCMVARGDVDALVSGMTMHYPETIRPALEVIGAHPKAGLVSGMYMLVFNDHVVFCADTTVNIDPSAEQLAQIAYAASRITRTFGIEPRIAMLSFSNFGSVRHPDAEKVARAVKLLRQRDPTLLVDGEMQADTALVPELLHRDYPFSTLGGRANVLIFPNLSAGNIAYKLLNHLGGATAIGPILVGMNRPVHVLERGAEVQEIVNMAAVAVVDAQTRSFSTDAMAPSGNGAGPTVFSRL